jgi:hypothetical protein
LCGWRLFLGDASAHTVASYCHKNAILLYMKQSKRRRDFLGTHRARAALRWDRRAVATTGSGASGALQVRKAARIHLLAPHGPLPRQSIYGHNNRVPSWAVSISSSERHPHHINICSDLPDSPEIRGSLFRGPATKVTSRKHVMARHLDGRVPSICFE